MCVCGRNQSALFSLLHAVIAFGKAVIGMVKAVEDVIGNHLISGVACVPAGTLNALSRVHPEYCPDPQSQIRYVPNPLCAAIVLLCS